MKYCKSNLFSIFLIIVAIVIVISTSGLIFRAVKQSNVYEGFTDSGPIVTGIALQYKSVGTGASSSGLGYSSWCSNVPDSVCYAEYRLRFSNGVTSSMTIQSDAGLKQGLTNPDVLFALSDIPSSGVTAILQGKNITANTSDTNWYDIDIPQQTITPTQQTVKFSGTTSKFIITPPPPPLPLPPPVLASAPMLAPAPAPASAPPAASITYYMTGPFIGPSGNAKIPISKIVPMGNQSIYVIQDGRYTKMVQWPSNIAKYYTGDISMFSVAKWVDGSTLQAPGRYILTPTPPTPPTPAPNNNPDVNTNVVCIPTNSDGSFTYKDPNSKYSNKPDPNYIYSNSNPPASGIFDQWTANYNQYVSTDYISKGSSDINKYSTYAPLANSLVPNGTTCTTKYSCPPNTSNTYCLPGPGPTPPSCPSNCKKVTGKDLLMANATPGVCSFDKKSETYTCSPCPTYGSDGMDCNQFQECSGCPASMTVPGLTPIDPPRKRRKRRGGWQCGGIDGICYKGNGGLSDGSGSDGGLSDGGGNGNGGWSGGGGNGNGGWSGGGGNGDGTGGWSGGGGNGGWASYGPYGNNNRYRYYGYGDGYGGDVGGDVRYGNKNNIKRNWVRNQRDKYKTKYDNGYRNNESEGCKQGINFIKKIFGKIMNNGGSGGIGTPVPYIDYIHF